METIRKLVYVEYGTENSPAGAELRSHPEDKFLEITRDRTLIDASCSSEESQGIVSAYLGIDGHWHLDHRLSGKEIREHKL